MRLSLCIIALMVTGLLAGCSTGPKPIRYGVENCTHCMMTISDARYATQLVTPKGKTYTFDSIECMASYIAKNEDLAIHSLWVTDFQNPETLLPVDEAFFLHSRQLLSPMGMNLTAFGPAITQQAVLHSFGGDILDWNGVLALVEAHGKHTSGHATHPVVMK